MNKVKVGLSPFKHGKFVEDRVCHELQVGRIVKTDAVESTDLLNPGLCTLHDASKHGAINLSNKDRVTKRKAQLNYEKAFTESL